MAVTAHSYCPFVFGQLSGTDERRIDWVNDTIKVLLMKPTYVPDVDNHGFYSDVSANELGAEVPNYTVGGKELAEKTEQQDAATNTTRLKAQTLQWKEVTLEARYAIIYK